MRFSPCPHRLCLYFFKHVAASLPLVLCNCVSVLWHCLSPACLSPRCSSNQWLSRSQQCQWHSHLQRWAPPHSLLNASRRYDASQYKLSFSYIYLCRSFLLALYYRVSCHFSVHAKPFVCGKFITEFYSMQKGNNTRLLNKNYFSVITKGSSPFSLVILQT